MINWRKSHTWRALTLWVLPYGSLAAVIGLAGWALLFNGGSSAGHKDRTCAVQATSEGATTGAATTGAATSGGATAAEAPAASGCAYSGTTGPISHPDFFTNHGHYMQRTGCLATEAGTPDWPWIIALIVLNAGIVLAYLRIYIFWTRAYLAEQRRDRNGKLMDLAQVFLWCAICGYVAGIVMFFWPAYRLAAICLFILNVWSWRFVLNLKSFRPAFSAGRFRRLANSDTLTGLPNRAAIRDVIDHRLTAWREGKAAPFAVLFLDFDRFKLVNDTLGHDAGDDLLRAISRRLSNLFRDTDELAHASPKAARLGGDEFVVVLDDCETDQRAMDVANRVVKCFEEEFIVKGRAVRSLPSIGVVVANQKHRSADDVLRDADVAMYAAKRDELHAVAACDDRLLGEIDERLSLETDLHAAVERDQLVLFYQPIIDLESGEQVGWEALVRWIHPERGMVPPLRFITIAEEIGIISEIGEWVYQQAIRQLAEWTAAGHADWRMHINFSTNQLYDSELADRVIDCAEQAGVLPSRVVAEVTESLFVTKYDVTRQTLDRLREAGFRLALDDFGTGYSSLSMLHQLPIDELKIDRSFVNNLAERSEYAAIIHAIVALAENMKIDVVAEGIEEADQLASLQSLGCNFAQGYYFARPMPADEAFAWAGQWRQERKSA